MSIRLVHTAETPRSVDEAKARLAEVMAVVHDLRRFVAECREEPSLMEQLTAADLAQAKALLAKARALLTHARLSVS